MGLYMYHRLDVKSQEIRLLTLLSGAFDNNLRIQITHVPFFPPDEPPNLYEPRIQKLQQTLPEGWLVYETTEGRFIFKEKASGKTYWSHPDPGFDMDRYNNHLRDSLRLDVGQTKYEALSYTWGSSEGPYNIYVEKTGGIAAVGNTDDCSILPVQRNLEAALRHLRSDQESRILWIDALCINQDDLEERSEQVGRMKNIYKHAHRVVVWLGPEENNSGLAIDTLQFLGEQVVITQDNIGLASPTACQRDWHIPRLEMPYDQKTWNAVDHLAARPWFGRLWIWQEIRLANSEAIFQCGSRQIPWTVLRRAFLCLYSKRKLPGVEFHKRLKSIRNLSQHGSPQQLFYHQYTTNDAKCTDPRDRIYALLGMLPPILACHIHPDYSLSVGNIYKKASLADIKVYRNLKSLIGCDLSERTVTAPTWVPDWSVHRGTELVELAKGTAGTLYMPRPKYTEPDILEVTGVRCSIITHVTEAAPKISSGILIHDIIACLRKWMPDNLHESSYITGEPLLDAFVATLCFDNTWLRRYMHWAKKQPYEEYAKIFMDMVVSNRVSSEADIESNPYLSKVLGSVEGRSFIITKDGHIGLGSRVSEPGDVVCVLLGCNAPMILRQQPDGTHKVVGACYIHGLMNAEAVLGPLVYPWERKIERSHKGFYIQIYTNTQTGTRTTKDPRMPSLPPTLKDDEHELMLDAFRQRGVALQTFRLV